MIQERWRTAADKSRDLEDPWAEFLIEETCAVEKAKRHRYNARKKAWVVDDILVKVQSEVSLWMVSSELCSTGYLIAL